MKNLKNLGKTLNRNEQKEINGGIGIGPSSQSNCFSDCDCFTSHGTLFICQDFSGGAGVFKRCVNGFSVIDPFSCPNF